MDTMRAARVLGAGGLLAVAAVHANWARGSAWPAPDRHALADAIIGWEEMPGAVPCMGVAAMLTVGAALVAVPPRRAPGLQRFGAAGVVAALAGRGVFGLTPLVTAEGFSPAFVRWNRRLYSPLCFVLAALCAAGVADRSPEMVVVG